MKLYVDEAEADAVRELANLVVSRLARVEIPSALWRKQRTGELRTDVVSVLIAEFQFDWTSQSTPRFHVAADSDFVLVQAAALVGAHGLRAYDAVQLATAVAARSADPSLTAFACFDTGLRQAAAAQGFTLVPV